MEGPSLYLAAEQLIAFKGKTVRVVSGNTTIGKERLLDQEVKDVFAWGKHLVFQFPALALRTHFMLFGTYEATIDGISVTGEYKRAREPRLALEFDNGSIFLFNCSLKYLETNSAKDEYDFSSDIMSAAWDSDKAYARVGLLPKEEIGDILLDQDIFAGVGNIIKNEVLFLCHIRPERVLEAVSDEEIRSVIAHSQSFSYQFYLWRKEFALRKHLQIYHKATCPVCGSKVTRRKTGKRQRWSYACPHCQK